MTVKLPGIYGGRQVLEAFKRACSFRADGIEYSAKDTGVKYQYEPGSVRQTIQNAGARLVWLSHTRRKKFLFFGPAVEETEEKYFAELIPVCMDREYSEVEIKSFATYIDAFGDLTHCWSEPGSPYFNRALVEKLIGNFYQELQSLSV